MVRDYALQAEVASALLREGELIAVSRSCRCEFVWVLRPVYGFGQSDVSAALRAPPGVGNIAVDRPPVNAGLAVFEAGGDVADGLTAHRNAGSAVSCSSPSMGGRLL